MKPKVKTWIKNLQNGNIKSKTVKVLKAIHSSTKSGNYTDIYQLRTLLDMSHQTLTAILSQIQDEGMIDMFGSVQHGNNYYSKIRYARPEERVKLICIREQEKFTTWLKKFQEYKHLSSTELIDAIEKQLKND